MERNFYNGVEFLTFSLLKQFPEIVHGVFLRKGGVSTAPHSSLNMGDTVGDNPENVQKNRELLLEVLGVDFLAFGSQKHENHVIEVDPHLTGSKESKVPFSSDGICTQKKGVALGIFHADCQAALFYDPVKKVIANIHCGWRGNVQNIYEKTVLYLKAKYGSDPKNLHVCISPSLGPNVSEFINYEKEWPQEFHKFMFKPNYFDLWEMSLEQLKGLKIPESQIEIARMCTFANEEDFYSYRREKLEGRHLTAIGVKK